MADLDFAHLIIDITQEKPTIDKIEQADAQSCEKYGNEERP